jgi:hypothetical protein
MFLMLLALMPATYYAQASFLMGAFISGLTFCSNHEAHHWFVSQLKRVMTWLIRIFFAASIGFQVPIKEFANGTVIWQGLVFTLALTGKLVVGFMVPNFTPHGRFTGDHLRDCLIVGFSMAAEGEFAFVIAVFAVDAGLISVELYASIVLAVLLSTILAPFALRMTISYYNKKTQKIILDAEILEQDRDMELEDVEKELVDGIVQHTTVFLCIQTHSDSGWGLLPKIMSSMGQLKLEIIDHRSWNPRGVNTTLVNEIYCKDTLKAESGEADNALEARLSEVQAKLLKAINQPNARVKVHRWFPGVVEEIVEETTIVDGVLTTRYSKNVSVQDQLMNEAQSKLEASKSMQLAVTMEKTVEQIREEQGDVEAGGAAPEGLVGAAVFAPPQRRSRMRKKTNSTPVVGGDMFCPVQGIEAVPSVAYQPSSPALPSTIQEDSAMENGDMDGSAARRSARRIKTRSTPATGGDLFGGGAAPAPGGFSTVGKTRTTFNIASPSVQSGGLNVAELLIGGKLYRVILNDEMKDSVLKDARLMRENVSSLKKKASEPPSFDTMLTGFVRKNATPTVPEDEAMGSEDLAVEEEPGYPSMRAG